MQALTCHQLGNSKKKSCIRQLNCTTVAVAAVQEKLRLDMTDEDAGEWMQQLLNDSASALMPQITDRTHRWATYWLR